MRYLMAIIRAWRDRRRMIRMIMRSQTLAYYNEMQRRRRFLR